MKLLFSVLPLIVVGLALCSASCPSGWIQNCSMCYKFVTSKLNWFQAEGVCKDLSGSLAAVDTVQRSAFISGYINLSQKGWKNVWWTRGRLIAGKWKWPSSVGGGADFSYTNWGPTEPNNNGAAKCVGLNNAHQGGWSDEFCQSSYYYICEKKAGVQIYK